MRLRTFNANDGDCLLLSSSDGHHMLVDGGRGTSFRNHAAKSVSECGTLDLVCVSHIDSDHISGILEMLEHEVDWRVHELEKADPPDGRPSFPEPRVPRPPKILQVWHNGFGDQLDDGATDVRNMLSLAASSQLSLADANMIPRQLYLADLALGEKQAIELTNRLGVDQLGIRLNAHFEGKLILAGVGPSTFGLGQATLTVIGPFEEDVQKLREEWMTWVGRQKKALDELRDEMARDADRLGQSEAETFLLTMAALSGSFGDRESVTTPNLASIMLLGEEDGHTVLLTGDGAGQDVIKGLEQLGRLDGNGCIHVDVLKVQHHGAAANIDADFCRAVIADHYVFCGNGSHHNPELGVIELIGDARMGEDGQRSVHPKTEDSFALHFNNSSATAGTEARTEHMIALEARVQELTGESGGQMTASFHTGSFFDIDL